MLAAPKDSYLYYELNCFKKCFLQFPKLFTAVSYVQIKLRFKFKYKKRQIGVPLDKFKIQLCKLELTSPQENDRSSVQSLVVTRVL